MTIIFIDDKGETIKTITSGFIHPATIPRADEIVELSSLRPKYIVTHVYHCYDENSVHVCLKEYDSKFTLPRNNIKSMRNLVLDEIERIKNQKSNKGFTSEKWSNFYVGAYHISKFKPEGMEDEMLFDFYNEVVKWHYSEKGLI